MLCLGLRNPLLRRYLAGSRRRVQRVWLTAGADAICTILNSSGLFRENFRRSAVENVGGFNAALRSGEDADLGLRLRGAGYNVVFDPNLFAYSVADNTVREVLERYARWNTPEGMGIRNYLRQINYALKVMAVADLKAGDIPAACISLLCPHNQFWTRR
jgi:Glycosyl transferase family group 2